MHILVMKGMPHVGIARKNTRFLALYRRAWTELRCKRYDLELNYFYAVTRNFNDRMPSQMITTAFLSASSRANTCYRNICALKHWNSYWLSWLYHADNFGNYGYRQWMQRRHSKTRFIGNTLAQKMTKWTWAHEWQIADEWTQGGVTHRLEKDAECMWQKLVSVERYCCACCFMVCFI